MNEVWNSHFELGSRYISTAKCNYTFHAEFTVCLYWSLPQSLKFVVQEFSITFRCFRCGFTPEWSTQFASCCVWRDERRSDLHRLQHLWPHFAQTWTKNRALSFDGVIGKANLYLIALPIEGAHTKINYTSINSFLLK